MELLFSLGLFLFISWLARQIIYCGTWPKYFRNDSMRIVPGETSEEFHIEILNQDGAGRENWQYLTTLYGFEDVKSYVEEQDAKQAEIKKAFRPKK